MNNREIKKGNKVQIIAPISNPFYGEIATVVEVNNDDVFFKYRLKTASKVLIGRHRYEIKLID